MRTTCENCQNPIRIRSIDADGVLVGDECPHCGYYVTRYMPGQDPDAGESNLSIPLIALVILTGAFLGWDANIGHVFQAIATFALEITE